MGALRKSARSPGDELGDYYVAALGFIDPRLTADSPLEEILKAVEGRRHKLLERPLFQVEDELGALNEALHFVQRVLSGTVTTTPATAEYLDVDVDAEIAGPEPTLSDRWAAATGAMPLKRAAEAAAGVADSGSGQPSLFPDNAALQPAATPVRAPVPAATKAATPTDLPTTTAARPVAMDALSGAGPGQTTLPAQPPAAEARPPAVPAAKVAGNAGLITATPLRRAGYRRRSLQEAMEQARHDAATGTAGVPQSATASTGSQAAQSPALPEVQAWPVAVGLSLVAWQAWLACFNGWTATRFLAWPRPGIGYELGWLAAAGLILLGLVTAAITARLVWVARRRSRRIATLVNLSAAVTALNLLAWWLAAQRLGTLIDGPPAWHLAGLVAAWLLMLPVVRLNDLLVSRVATRHLAAADRTVN